MQARRATHVLGFLVVLQWQQFEHAHVNKCAYFNRNEEVDAAVDTHTPYLPTSHNDQYQPPRTPTQTPPTAIPTPTPNADVFEIEYLHECHITHSIQKRSSSSV